MKHTHDDTRLTFGCPACIARVERDQRRAAYVDWTDDRLYDHWTSNPLHADDAIVARLLIERGVLTVEEVEAASGDVRMILAFDLGLKVTGVAGPGWSDHHIAPAHLRRSPITPIVEHDRMCWWWDTFARIMDENAPTSVWVEAPFIHPKHIAGAQSLILLHGIFRAVAIDHDAALHEVTPAELKRWAAGSGNATKSEMMDAARLMGWVGDDHNEADAFLLWHYARAEEA